jgi:hypothetical protein
MSVKKSLWLSVVLVMAMSLLFLGCPTEADSSEEMASYEQTALWAACYAELDLNRTQASDAMEADVVTTAKWVTPVQCNAFKRAVDDARELN